MKIDMRENLKMALNAVFANKLRSFLTLVGVVAGVASIIAVMTGIAVIQGKMEADMSQLGSGTFQVQKWPAIGGPGQNWRKIRQRKPLTIEQANAIRERIRDAELVGAELWEQGSVLQHEEEKTNPNVSLAGGTPEFQINNNQLVGVGRFISEEDVKVGRNVIVIGTTIAKKLFPFKDPIDQIVKINGHKYTVIGIYEEMGASASGSGDNSACIPISAFVDQFGLKDNQGMPRSVNITVKARAGANVENVMEEVRGLLRQVRGVKPLDEDDFDMYSNDTMIRAFGEMTVIIKLVAIVMGGIALIVAGIGIMNIMLVSVTERTKEIGIRKAIGAKRKDIMQQFLIEAIVLCEIGGAIGIMVGMAIGNIVSILMSVPVKLPLDWAIIGLVFCSGIGIAFGIWPASKASKLDPIESLRFE
ncbi:ABC transporter permease [bacterium]|nr:ABC transporter permease [bacterium]NUN45626.1 ABC transporter permease [bacterium]HMV26069.1 ABC transporter permease [bacterium]HMW33522.1 ABC transporter permease [bacterium]HMW35128.1 ABC transporter permease [bacterium]